LRGLVGVSLGIHLVIFMHIAGIYRSNAFTYIELTLQGVSKPPARSIPRPRHRPKAHQPLDVKRLKVAQPVMPHLKPIRIQPAEKDLPDSLVEGISMPDISATPGLNIANWNPGASVEASGHYATSLSYLEMVRLKIERHKKYPGAARVRSIEGRVTIRFSKIHRQDKLKANLKRYPRWADNGQRITVSGHKQGKAAGTDQGSRAAFPVKPPQVRDAPTYLYHWSIPPSISCQQIIWLPVSW